MWRFQLNIFKGFCLAKATWFLISFLSAVCHLLSWSFLSMNPLLKAPGKGCASCWPQRQKHGYCPRMCRTAQNDRYRERKNKVEGVNGKQFLSLIGLHFSAIFVSTGSQKFVLHSLVPFFCFNRSKNSWNFFWTGPHFISSPHIQVHFSDYLVSFNCGPQ